MLSAKEHPKKFVSVLGQRMAYVEMGSGDPIVFQHGNPTSSYLWRNIMPTLAKQGRCIALDLIGMGDSDKLTPSGPDRYTLAEHQRFFDAAMDALGVANSSPSNNVTLVLHDWGSSLGFDWARRHAGILKGICYMEAIVRPMEWSQWPAAATPVFKGFRSPAGEDMALTKNVFVERVLPGSILRKLTEEEMGVYRRPFTEAGESRRPTLTWPRQIPLGGEPADVVAVVQRYADWLAKTAVPKLFVNAEPGAILIGAQREFCRSFPNQREVTVRGNHFLQEDSPDEIAAAISTWLASIPR
jgi:haloalkane dehalogenase